MTDHESEEIKDKTAKEIIQGLESTRKAILESHSGDWVSGSKKIRHMCLINDAIAYISKLEEGKKDE